MATATATNPRLTREQAAEALLEHLGNEPQAAAVLARAIGYQNQSSGRSQIITSALGVLQARGQVKLIPHSEGKRDGGWVLASSPHQAQISTPLEIEFDYDLEKHVALDQMFVDRSYQRPLTSLVKQIERKFDPYLFQTLMLSDRGARNEAGRYALIDGQTRWVAATRIGVQNAPAQIFRSLTPEQEADIFWRVQKNRHGMVSYYRFRAQLRAGDEQSLRIEALATSCGYTLGSGPGQLRAVSALETCFKQDDFTLERVLSDLREAWPNDVPEGTHINGLHFFFRHYPLDQPRQRKDVDDERLVRRLKVTGPDGLHQKARSAKDVGGKGTSARWMATAVQSAYHSGGRS